MKQPYFGVRKEFRCHNIYDVEQGDIFEIRKVAGIKDLAERFPEDAICQRVGDTLTVIGSGEHYMDYFAEEQRLPGQGMIVHILEQGTLLCI